MADPEFEMERVYIDSGGVLRAVSPDGTDAPLGGGGAPALHGALMYLGGSYDPGGGGTVPLASVDFDSDGYASIADNGFVIPAGLGGAYLFTVNSPLNMTDAPTKFRLWLDFTNEPTISNPETDWAPVANGWNVGMVAMGQFAEGSTITLHAARTGGTGFTMDGPTMGITYLGAVT